MPRVSFASAEACLLIDERFPNLLPAPLRSTVLFILHVISPSLEHLNALPIASIQQVGMAEFRGSHQSLEVA